jgi:long-chain acyl-CoA synthetase
MFLDRVAATPDREAFRRPVGEGWESMTWREAGDRVEALAAGLLELGVGPEDRVAVISSTRVEWILADCAVMCAGATRRSRPPWNGSRLPRAMAARAASAPGPNSATAKLRDHRADCCAADRCHLRRAPAVTTGRLGQVETCRTRPERLSRT